MTTPNELFLHEEALLLALREQQGTTEMGAWYHQAVGGSVLAELLLRGRVRAVPRGRGDVLEVLSSEPVGDALVDLTLERIAAEDPPRPLRDWVRRVANERDLKHTVARGLVRRGILRADEDKLLLIFTRRVYPEIDPEPERAVVERLRRALEGDDAELDPRTVVLLSLAHATGLLRANFERELLRARKDRIEAVVAGEATGGAVEELVAATRAAVAVISIACMPAVIHS